MDTREKIITSEQAFERAPECGVVLASFDVLTAERIRRLQEIRQESPCLIAVLTGIEGSLLTVTARAELAASLSAIDLVVMLESPEPIMERAARVYDEREADTRRATDLIQYVHRRNRA